MDNQLPVPLWVAEGEGGDRGLLPPSWPALLTLAISSCSSSSVCSDSGKGMKPSLPAQGHPFPIPSARQRRTGPYLSSPLCVWEPSQE